MGPDVKKIIFVNKDARSTSLSRSQGGERAFILSHAQRHRHRGTTSHQPWSQHTSEFPFIVQSDKTSDDKNEPALMAFFSSPACNGSDPFHCTIAAMDAGSHAMLRFTFDQGAKATFLAETFAPSALVQQHTMARHNRAITERLKRCVEDEALMYSTLAYGSCCQGWMGGILDKSLADGYLVSKALRAVRQRLENTRYLPADDWLALSIYCLAITEFWTNTPVLWTRCPEMIEILMRDPKVESSTARIHRNALKRVVDSTGGWNLFDQYVLESTILADKFLALSELTTPLLSLTWDPITIYPVCVECSTTIRLGQDLLSKTTSFDLTLVIKGIISYINYATRYWSCLERSTKTENNLFLKFQALTYRLLNLQDLTKIDNCICLTTLIFQLCVTQYQGSQISARTLVPRLRQALCEANFRDNEFESGIRAWCLYTAAITAEESPDRRWFVGMIQRFELPWLYRNQIEERMSGYLCLPERQSTKPSSLINSTAA